MELAEGNGEAWLCAQSSSAILTEYFIKEACCCYVFFSSLQKPHFQRELATFKVKHHVALKYLKSS